MPNFNDSRNGSGFFFNPQAPVGSVLARVARTAAIRQQWETKIARWSANPSETEEERINRTLRMVAEAINADSILSALEPMVFLQGSYKNQTNIRVESDVDVAIVLRQTVYYRWAPTSLFTQHQQYLPPPPPPVTAVQFRGYIKRALGEKFGTDFVNPGNKALKVRASSARVNADIVPLFPYEYHYTDASGPQSFTGGYALIQTDGDVIFNLPHHHFHQGIAKDITTNGKYKMMVRFFKQLNVAVSLDSERLAPFFIESLVFNCPDIAFAAQSPYDTAISILNTIEAEARSTSASSWTEANAIKGLWNSGQTWVKSDALRFAQRAKRAMESQ